jgi:hypothetical protein
MAAGRVLPRVVASARFVLYCQAMPIRTELNVRLPNSPGALGVVCRLMYDERVNVIAMSLDATGQLRLVVDNHVHAAGTLRERHYPVAERSVLLVPTPNAPGALMPTLMLLADAGINLEYAYGASSDTSPVAAVVLGVEDAVRAAAAAGV